VTDTLMLTEAYRPYFVDDIIGQPRTKKLVGGWLRQSRIPRTILISGEFSSGKTTFGRILARSALCHAPKDGNACAECKSCVAFDKDNHNDYIEMNAASDRGINDMRELTKKLPIRPLLGKKKVVVLDEAHMITGPGWQAMLKVLEEPPPHVILIVLTTNPEKLPKTIISRCSQIKLSGVTIGECTQLLMEVAKKEGLGKAGLTEAHLQKVAKVTGAHPRNALHALEQIYTMVLDAKDAGQTVDAALINAFIKDVAVADVETTAAAVIRGVLMGKPGGALKRAEDNYAEADQLLTKLTEMMRQAMMYSVSPKLLDPYYKDLFTEDLTIFQYTSGKDDGHLEARKALLDAYACFTDLRIRTSTYMVPIGEVIGEAIARAGLLCQILLKDRGGFEAPNKAKKKKKKTAQQHQASA